MERIIKYLESVEMWRLNVCVNGEYKKLGYFESEPEANEAADKYFAGLAAADPVRNDGEILYIYDIPYELNHVGTELQRAYSYKNLSGYYFELIRYTDGTWAWHLERHWLNREKFLADSRPDLKYDSAVNAHDAMVLFFNGLKN